METSRSYRHERQAAVRERDDLAAVKGNRVETPVPTLWLGFRGLWPIGAQSGPSFSPVYPVQLHCARPNIVRRSACQHASVLEPRQPPVAVGVDSDEPLNGKFISRRWSSIHIYKAKPYRLEPMSKLICGRLGRVNSLPSTQRPRCRRGNDGYRI